MNKRTKKLLAGVLIFALLAGVVFFAPLGPVLSFWVEKTLGDRIAATVEIEALDFRLYRGMRAKRVTINPEGLPGETIILEDISVDHRAFGLLKGSYRVDRIHIGNAVSTAGAGMVQWASDVIHARDMAAELPDIEVDDGIITPALPEFFRPVHMERFRASVTQHDGERISGSVMFSAGGNDVEVAFVGDAAEGFVEADVLATGFDLSFLPALEVAGVGVEPSRIKVRGVLSGTVTFLTSPGQWVGDLSLTGLTAGHPEAGLVVTGGSSRIQIADREIVFHGTTLHAAGGRLTVPAAAIQLGEKGVAAFQVHGDAKGMDLDRLKEIGVFEFLPESFQPGRVDAGKADAAIKGAWSPGEGFDYRADVSIHDASGVLKDPEVDFTAFDAQAVITPPGSVRVQSASARFWEGRAEVAGTFDISEREIDNPDIDIYFEDVAENDALMAMLPEYIQDGVWFAGPSNGKIGGYIGLMHDTISLELDVYAEKLAPPALPFEFDGAAGTIRWSTGAPRVSFENVSGDIDGRPVWGSGALLVEDRLASDFTVSGEDIRLTHDLLDWLGIDTGQWRVDGRFDIDLQARDWFPSEDLVADSFAGIHSNLTLRDVSFSHPDYGRAVRSFNGVLSQGPGGVDLYHFTASVFGVDVDGSGRFPFDDKENNPYMTVQSETFDLTPKLFARLPIQTMPEDLDPGGRASFSGTIEALYDDGLVFLGDMEARFSEATITYSGTPIGASGSSRLRFSGDGLSGSVSLEPITIGNFYGDQLSGDFDFSAPVIEFRNVHLAGYGGSMASEKTWINVSDKSWSTDIDLSGVDIESVAESFGIMQKQRPTGSLQSSLSLEGRSFDTLAIKGAGEATIKDGRLYSFPILLPVLSLFDLKLPTQNPVSDAYGVFRIDSGVIVIEDLFFSGGAIPIHMDGYIGLQNDVAFKDQPIYMIVTLARKEGVADRIPFVNFLKHHTIDFLRRVVLQARVTGTCGDYKVETLATPVTRQIQKMWSFLEQATEPINNAR